MGGRSPSLISSINVFTWLHTTGTTSHTLVIMRPSTVLLACLLYAIYRSGCSAKMSDCKTPPFDNRRCYQLFLDNSSLSWDDASAACKTTGQRLASMETEKLVKFLSDSIAYVYHRAWIGLSRTSDGQPYTWTNGQKFDASQYPGVTLGVSGPPVGRMCAMVWDLYPLKNIRHLLVHTHCSVGADRVCETFRSNIFQVKAVGDVISDISSGHPVASNIVVSVIDCVRICKDDWACQAVIHDGVTCQLHFPHVGHNIIVSRDTIVYARMNSEDKL